jgi:Flp pilus assembly pilin Flp
VNAGVSFTWRGILKQRYETIGVLGTPLAAIPSQFPKSGPALFEHGEIMSSCFTFLKEEKGATSIEYAVCMVFILVACIGAVRSLGGKASEVWGDNSTGIVSFLQNL